MPDKKTVNIDTLADFGSVLPLGDYTFRLVASEGKDSKAAKPMVVATWEVVGGPQDAEEATSRFSLSVTERDVKRKDGRTEHMRFAGGIQDMKKVFAIVGKPLPAGFEFPLDKDLAAKLFFSRVNGVLLDGTVGEEVDKNDPEKKYTKVIMKRRHAVIEDDPTADEAEESEEEDN